MVDAYSQGTSRRAGWMIADDLPMVRSGNASMRMSSPHELADELRHRTSRTLRPQGRRHAWVLAKDPRIVQFVGARTRDAPSPLLHRRAEDRCSELLYVPVLVVDLCRNPYPHPTCPRV